MSIILANIWFNASLADKDSWPNQAFKQSELLYIDLFLLDILVRYQKNVNWWVVDWQICYIQIKFSIRLLCGNSCLLENCIYNFETDLIWQIVDWRKFHEQIEYWKSKLSWLCAVDSYFLCNYVDNDRENMSREFVHLLKRLN